MSERHDTLTTNTAEIDGTNLDDRQKSAKEKLYLDSFQNLGRKAMLLTGAMLAFSPSPSLAGSDQKQASVSEAEYEALMALPWNIETAILRAEMNVFVGDQVGLSQASSAQYNRRLFTNKPPYNTGPLAIMKRYEDYLRSQTEQIDANPDAWIRRVDTFIDPYSQYCTSNQAVSGLVKYRLNPKNKKRVQVQSANLAASGDEQASVDDFNNDGVSTSFTVACREKDTYKLTIGGMIADKRRTRFISSGDKISTLLDTTLTTPTDTLKKTQTKHLSLKFTPNKDKTRPRMLIMRLKTLSRFHPKTFAPREYQYMLRKPTTRWKTVKLEKGEKPGNNTLSTSYRN